MLSVVTSLPGPNFWGTTKAEVDPDNIKSGIEYDLANMIAAKCGLKMEFRNENFDAIVAGQIDPTSYDIVLVAGDDHRRSRQGRRLLGRLLQGRPGSARQQGNDGEDVG